MKLKHRLPTHRLLTHRLPALTALVLATAILAQSQSSALAQAPTQALAQAPVQAPTQNSTQDSTQALAQAPSQTPDLDLTVFPPTAYLTVKPGTTSKHQVLLEHQGSAPLTLTPQLVDFETDGLTGRPVLKKPSKLTYIEIKNPGWKLDQATKLKPDSKLQLTLEISPPIHAQLDEYPLSLVLTAEPSTEVIRDGSRAQAGGAVASNIILSVQPDYKNLGELVIEKLNLPRLIDSFGQLKFETLAYNEGRNAVAAQGQVELSHLWSGKVLKNWFIYPDVILADSNRRLRGLLTNPKQLEPGDEVVFEDFSYKPAFLFGPYQIKVSLSDASQEGFENESQEGFEDESQKQTSTDQQDLVHERTKAVFAAPFSAVGLLLLGVVLFLGYNWWEKRLAKKTPPLHNR